MNLKLVGVRITNSLTDRGRVCELSLAPQTSSLAPVGEYAFDGDVALESGTNLRPNGTVVQVFVAYGTVAKHCIFRGVVEYMDDLTDPDIRIYRVTLSDAPIHDNHRTRLTKTYNMVALPSSPALGVSAHTILSDLCTKVGIPFGRCDMPDYKVWGTYEVVRRTILEVAEDLVQPFQYFDHTRYFVRCDETNGLQIIRVKFREGAEVSQPYSVSSLMVRNQSFQKYMPDNRIGPNDVLITGADQYGPDSTDGAMLLTAYHQYHTQSKGSDEAATSYTETWLDVEFKVSVVPAPGVEYAGGGRDLDQIVDDLGQGLLSSVQIVESYQTKQTTDRYEDDERVQRTETTFEYADLRFPRRVYSPSEYIAKTHVAEHTLTTDYPDGSDYDSRMERRYFQYTDTGVQKCTTTYAYNNDRGKWYLENQQTEFNDAASETSAQIEYYMQKARLGAEASSSSSGSGRTTFSPIRKYQLLNGEEYSPYIIPNPADPNGNFNAEIQRMKMAFQISCPHMDLAGLKLVNALAEEEKLVEKSNGYWQVVKGKLSLDTSPCAGESLILGGIAMMVENVVHEITENEALTTVEGRRIVSSA